MDAVPHALILLQPLVCCRVDGRNSTANPNEQIPLVGPDCRASAEAREVEH